jgi:hypothetical protein
VLDGPTHERLVPGNYGQYVRHYPASVVASQAGKGITDTSPSPKFASVLSVLEAEGA